MNAAAALNSTTNGDVFYLYKISVFHYGLISCLLVILVGMPISLLTGKNHQIPHHDLLSPLLHKWLPATQTEVSTSEVSLRRMEDRDHIESV